MEVTIKFKDPTGAECKSPITVEASNVVRAIEKLVTDGVDLSYADLRRADLSGINLTSAKIMCADFSGAKMPGCTLKNAFALEAVFNYACLHGADFTGSDLREAQFHHSDLSNCIMRDANLSDAWFMYSNLNHADLRGAGLAGAYLSNTDTIRTKIGGGNISNVKFDFVHLENILHKNKHLWHEVPILQFDGIIGNSKVLVVFHENGTEPVVYYGLSFTGTIAEFEEYINDRFTKYKPVFNRLSHMIEYIKKVRCSQLNGMYIG